MADEEQSIEAFRLYYANSGRETRSKRKLSGKIEESSEKRDKKSSQVTKTDRKMESEDLAKMMKKVLMDDEITEILVSKFKKACDERIDERMEEFSTEIKEVKQVQEKQIQDLETVEKRMDKREQDSTEHEKRADKFDQRIDILEQKELERNIIISGVPREQSNKDEIRKILNEKLKCNVASTDIHYIMKVKSGEEDEKSNVKIAFTTVGKKKQVMQAKKKLKGEEIWITDDLTAYRRSLAYQARKAVREGKALQTWVTDGKVFLKETPKEKPKKIHFLHDIPGHENGS